MWRYRWAVLRWAPPNLQLCAEWSHDVGVARSREASAASRSSLRLLAAHSRRREQAGGSAGTTEAFGGMVQNSVVSMIREYVRLRPHELVELRRLLAEEPDEAYEYAGDLGMAGEDEQTSSRGMDTDKAWAGLQYLLAKLDSPHRCHRRRRTDDR